MPDSNNLSEETKQEGRDFLESANNLVARLTDEAEITEEIGDYQVCLRRHTWSVKSSGLYNHRYEAITLNKEGKTLLKYRAKSPDRFLAFYVFNIVPFTEQLKKLREETQGKNPNQANQLIEALRESIRQDHQIPAVDY